ncbi:MAG: CBS domain-containing protein [Streptosporangiaceae bacterium]
MTSPAITIQARATVSQAARVMQSHQSKRLPVVGDDG